MPKISIRGNTLYYREIKHTEVVGVVDGQGTLWLKDIDERRNALERRPLRRPAGQEDRQLRAGVAGGAQVQAAGGRLTV